MSPDIKSGPVEDDLMVLKHEPSCGYLRIDSSQHRILQQFQGGNSVVKLLPRLIAGKYCPPLKVLYELILQAVRAGVLQDEANPPPKVKAREWNMRISEAGAYWIGSFCFLFGYGSFLVRNIPLPHEFWQVIYPYLIVSASITIGHILAACVLPDFECDVYPWNWHWKTPFQHFSPDLRDAAMGGRECEIAVGLLRMAPLLFVTGVFTYTYPSFVFVLMLGVIWVLFPLGNTATAQILKARFRRIRLSTTHNFLFTNNKRLVAGFLMRIAAIHKRYALLLLLFFCLWVVFVLFATYKLFQLKGIQLFTNTYGSGLKILGYGLLASIAVLVLLALFWGLWAFVMNYTALGANVRARDKMPGKHSRGNGVPSEKVLQLLRNSHLFQEFDDESLKTLSERFGHQVLRSKQYIIHEGETGDTLYVIYSGKVEIVRELKSGKPEKIAALGPGEVFGEISLIDNVPRTRSVRASRTTALLALDRKDFNELVLSRVSREKIEEIVQKRDFLYRTSLCRKWHPEAITRFAQLARLKTYAAGKTIIREGTRNEYFFIVYDGFLDVVKDSRKTGRLISGEFFGEISLLRNDVSVANVVARDKSRCLVIPKSEFYQFIGEDYLMGLHFEEIGTKRLKQPVFV